jgi:hypothetical protein
VLIPVRVSPDEVRIIALTSEREQVAPYAAQWALDVFKRPTED